MNYTALAPRRASSNLQYAPFDVLICIMVNADKPRVIAGLTRTHLPYS